MNYVHTLAALSAACCTAGCSSIQLSAADRASALAVADGVTTAVGLAGTAVEGNPLAPTDPLGILAFTALKAAVPHLASHMAPEDRKLVLQATSAAWGGAAVNNLLVIAGATGHVPVLGLVCAAVWLWRDTGRKVDAEMSTQSSGALLPH